MIDEKEEAGKAGAERVAKVIARSGLCSRREAEGLIEDRRVSVNGAIIESAALDVLPSDKVVVDGKPLLAPEPPRLWRYHKPKGRVTTHKDPEGRPTVFEALPENLPRLISIGRLDFNTEGLLLLTNDGDLARHLELPSTGWSRRYRVRAYGQVTEAQLQDLADGVTIDRVSYGPIEASLEREQGDNVWINVSIREGKNREVRRILEHLGLTVNRLIRVSFGPFILGDLETGQIEEVKTTVLKDQLGPRLSRQLGVRREIPREERPLAPGRAKPTYLRRKPVETRPERAGEEARPLKRRRILAMDGSEAPKVEFVAEPKPREGRFVRDGERGEKPPFRSRSSAREDGREPAARRFQKEPRGEGLETRRGPSEDRTRDTGESRPWRDRAERPERGAPLRGRPERAASGEKPQTAEWTPRTDAHFEEHKDRADGERPRFRKLGPDQRSERPRPPRRFEARGEGAGGERRPREGFESRGDRPRPPRRFEARGEGAAGERKPREGFEPRGDRPRPPRRFEDKAEGAAGERKPREGFKPRGDRPRPPRRFEDKAEGAAGERKPREGFKPRGDRPRPPRRFEARTEGTAGEHRPREGFEARGDRPRPPRRFEDKAEGAAGERKPREGFEARGDRPRPPRRFEDKAEGAAGERKPREGFEARGDRPRPPRRFEARAEGAAGDHKPREGFEARGDRPRPPRRFEGKAEGAAGERKPREGSEPRGERPRPPRRFEARTEGTAGERKPREGFEPRGDRPRPPRASFRPAAEGEGKPFKPRHEGGRSSGRGGGDRPAGKRGEGKPFRSGGKAAHAKPRSGPRKPGSRPGKEPS